MPHVAARMASRDVDAGRYQRHCPEQTLFYQLVDEYFPAFAALIAEHDCLDAGGRATYGAVAEGRELPGYVQREFEDYLNCGRLEYGFLRVRCESCHAEHLVAFSCKRPGFCPSCGARRMADDCRDGRSRSQSRARLSWSTRNCLKNPYPKHSLRMRGRLCASGC
jgi:ribosomal protein S27E